MKHKFGTVLEKNLIKELRKRAAEEDRPLANVVQDALAHYLLQTPAKDSALEAWERLNRPISVPNKDLALVMQLDFWEQ